MLLLPLFFRPQERKNVEYNLNTTGRDVINLSQEEIEHFAGNCLEVRSVDEAASSSSSSSSAFKQHLVPFIKSPRDHPH